MCQKIRANQVRTSLTHLVLCVAARFQVRCTHTNHIVGRHIREMSQNLTHSDHFDNPFLVAFVLQALLQRNCFGGHLMLIERQRLNLLIITIDYDYCKKKTENVYVLIECAYIVYTIYVSTRIQGTHRGSTAMPPVLLRWKINWLCGKRRTNEKRPFWC